MMVNVDEWLGCVRTLRIALFPDGQSRRHGNHHRFEEIPAGNGHVVHCQAPPTF
jgi:hypothetical protein